jgi:hypothetical protein
MSKNYTNEHPKYKKLSETKRIKLAHHKGNGKVGKEFMILYNHYKTLFASPTAAFKAAQESMDKHNIED